MLWINTSTLLFLFHRKGIKLWSRESLHCKDMLAGCVPGMQLTPDTARRSGPGSWEDFKADIIHWDGWFPAAPLLQHRANCWASSGTASKEPTDPLREQQEKGWNYHRKDRNDFQFCLNHPLNQWQKCPGLHGAYLSASPCKSKHNERGRSSKGSARALCAGRAV